jgi:spermidine synthase
VGDAPGPLNLWTRAHIAVLPCTVVMGMVLPLICAAYARTAAHAGRDIGIVYASNTLGTVAGALLPPFVLIPLIGIQLSLFLMAALYWVLGMALGRMAGGFRLRTGLAGLAVIAGAAVAVIPADISRHLAIPSNVGLRRQREVIFYSEGKTSTEIIARDVFNDRKYLYMNGAIEVTTAAPEMMSFKMMATLGIFLHRDPADVLMVCFGGGIASGTACRFPEVASVTAVDLERSVIRGARRLAKENYAVYDDPKFALVVDDGRNFLLTTDRRWPVIVSDSLHPRSSDAWVLYTKEFYEAARGALNDDGIFVQWVPYQGLSEAEYRSIVRTFQDVFPHISLWFAQGIAANGLYGGHTILVGTPGPLRIDVGLLKEHLSSEPVSADLEPWGLGGAVGVLDTFICGEDRLRAWAGDVPLNTDDLCYIQFETPLAAGPRCTRQSFAPLIEDPWPYLAQTGMEEESAALRAELAQHVRANTLFMNGRVTEAVAYLPDDRKMRNYREAMASGARWIGQVAGLYADDAEALSTLAFRALAIPGNGRQAIGLFQQALKLNSDDAITQSNLGYALMSEGELDASLPHFEAAIRLDPRLADAHYNMGVALAAKGERDRAAAAFAEAVRQDPSFASQVPQGYLR